MCIGEKRTLTIAPSYGYGDRSIGPIPAGSTLGINSPPRFSSFALGMPVPASPILAWLTVPTSLVFETELMGIDGVPQPESIVTKSATDTLNSEETQNVGDKVASAVSEATEAVKTVVADTDDTQEHNEL